MVERQPEELEEQFESEMHLVINKRALLSLNKDANSNITKNQILKL